MIEEYIPKFMDILYSDLKSSITLDEIRDALHTNQIISNNDAIIGFSKLPKTFNKNVLHIHPWFGILTRFLCEKYPNYTFSQLDTNNKFSDINKTFLKRNKNYTEYITSDILNFDNLTNYSTIIHLSVTDNTDWFNNLNDDTEVVLQSNKFTNINEMKSKYSLTNIYYENTIELNVYNRFTLVGKK